MESDILKKKKKGYVMPCRTDCDWGNCGLEYLGGCLVCVFKQQFSVFKQHFTHLNTLFHPHVFP